jgi:hypothetical protein
MLQQCKLYDGSGNPQDKIEVRMKALERKL